MFAHHIQMEFSRFPFRLSHLFPVNLSTGYSLHIHTRTPNTHVLNCVYTLCSLVWLMIRVSKQKIGIENCTRYILLCNNFDRNRKERRNRKNGRMKQTAERASARLRVSVFVRRGKNQRNETRCYNSHKERSLACPVERCR